MASRAKKRMRRKNQMQKKADFANPLYFLENDVSIFFTFYSRKKWTSDIFFFLQKFLLSPNKKRRMISITLLWEEA